MALPKRSRSHQLEDLSINKFRSLLPAEWVYRTPTHDYGIDGEVEIFDTNGYTTGIRFLVQLKASDSKKVNEALKLRLKIEKLNYFNQLNQPILIVRYIESTGGIYVRWFHSLNEKIDKIAEKSFCMIFKKENAWCDNTLKWLKDELDVYSTLKNHPVKKPLELDLCIATHTSLSSYTTSFVSQLIKSGHTTSIISFSIFDESQPRPMKVRVTNDEIHIRLGDLASFKARFDPPSNNEHVKSLVSDINVYLAFLLHTFTHDGEADCLFDAFFNSSNIKYNPHLFLSYISSKIRTNKISEILDYLVYIFDDNAGNRVELYEIIILAMVMVTKSANYSHYSKIENTYLQLLSKVDGVDHKLIASTLSYNLGNFLSNHGDKRKAIKYYINAARLNPDYKFRAYWISELAGLFFLLKKYVFSSKLYHLSLTMEPTSEMRGRYADSLMFSGKFEQAMKEFALSLEEDVGTIESSAEWCLKHHCLQEIVNVLGIKEQSVGPNASIEFMRNCSEEQAIDYIMNVNALCPECLFYVATKLAVKEDKDRALVFFLLSAFVDENYDDSWFSALKCAFDNIIIFGHIFLVMNYKFGYELIVNFFESLDLSNSEEYRKMILEVIKICEKHKEKTNKVKFRIGDGKKQEIMDI
ncbi:DUF4365 domain-containing protein [Aeromonas jandaei]|uniref:DUF4365 domain-containing protein n=1 Tax=Aeromonas jandaei TaxID=650 RepID=UPI003D2328AA